MLLLIKSRIISGVVVLDLTGRLWILDLPLRDKINALLNEGHRHFVLNLAGVNYVDSSGLGQLVTIWTSIKNRNGYMTVLNPTNRVRKLLDITKLNSIFEIHDAEPDAVKRAGGAL